tara:strand:- start:83 stop:304 length:222 start_codon:yes stop_codon:yes gene_type:complete
MIEVTRTSILTGKINTISLPVTQKQLDLYENSKELIQNVMPNLTNAQREFVKTGITEQEWDKLILDSSNEYDT